MLTLAQTSLRLDLRMADLEALVAVHHLDLVHTRGATYVPQHTQDRLRDLLRRSTARVVAQPHRPAPPAQRRPAQRRAASTFSTSRQAS